MSTFMKLGLIAVSALSVFAGCAADADKEASSESDVTSAGAGLGEECAGLIGIQCAPGLQCVIEPDITVVADAPGTCERPRAQEGDACGTGITGIPVVCAKGLECKGSGPADQMGTCEKAGGGEGDSCGRGRPCAEPFVCATEPDDRGGRCVPLSP